MRIGMRPRRQGSKKKARATTPASPLPQDVLAGILVRLQGSDLRRLRRVCREWRDIISDPQFIREHMVYKPKLPPTHTIVFFPGFAYGSRQDPGNGRGFLFDEHWQLKAELTAGRWDDLIGACDGLLCFLEAGQGSIKIIEPFTGESLRVQTPPEATWLRWTVNPAAYCFGFDATSRRYKIVHHDNLESSGLREGEAVDDEELHVYTVGGGEGWMRVHVAHEVHGQAYGNPLYVDGAVYWPSRARRSDTIHRRDEKLVRFDLATEKITSEATVRLRLDRRPMSEMALFCRLVDSAPCLMTYGRHCEWDAWFPEAEEGCAGCLPAGGLVLFSRWFDHGLYLHTMERNLEFGESKLLFEVGKKEPTGYKYNGRASFVPARRHKQPPIAGAPLSSKQCNARTTGYAPTVSAAPLALYFDL